MKNLSNSLRLALISVFTFYAAALTSLAVADDELSWAQQTAKTSCAACHGETGISPNENWPHLAGQKYGYLLDEMRRYRDRRRSDPLMSPAVAAMSDGEMQALARYYSQQQPPEGSGESSLDAASAHRGKVIAELCTPCHGVNGISIRDDWPSLGGQHSRYMVAQLHNFRDLTRQGFMVDPVHFITDEEFQMVADYFAKMQRCNTPEDSAVPCHQKNPGMTNEIREVGAGLYLHAWSFWLSPFLVTPEGIIITDPPSVEAGRWLKNELNQRFNVPVRYVVLSHSDLDHVKGTGVFADEATIIAHRNAKPIIEARLKADAAAAKRVNRKVDAPPEGVPDITFTEKMTLSLGGKTVKLEWLNPFSHGHDDMISMYFVEADLLYEADGVHPGGLGFLDFRVNRFPQVLEDTRLAEQKTYTHYLTGHVLATRAGVIEHRQYLEALNDAVVKAIKEGKSLEQAKNTIKLPAFAYITPWYSREEYEAQVGFNVEGVYLQLKAGMTTQKGGGKKKAHK